MPIGRNSILAYNALQTSGALDGMKWDAYDYLWNHGPMTAGEMVAAMPRSPDQIRPWQPPVLTWLKDHGLVKVTDARLCSATGHSPVDELDVTDAQSPFLDEEVRLAVALHSAKKRLEKLTSKIAYLEAKLARITAEAKPFTLEP